MECGGRKKELAAEAYLETVLESARQFVRSRRVFDRRVLLFTLTNLVESPGVFGCVLGGKNSLVLNAFAKVAGAAVKDKDLASALAADVFSLGVLPDLKQGLINRPTTMLRPSAVLVDARGTDDILSSVMAAAEAFIATRRSSRSL